MVARVSGFFMRLDIAGLAGFSELSLVIARMLGILVFFNALGAIPHRIKFLFVLCISVLVLPLVQPEIIRKLQENNFPMAFAFEFFIGSFLGSVISMYFNVLVVAANIISAQIGLSSVISFDPGIGEQSVVLSRLLSLAVIVAGMQSGIHLQFISFIVESYTLFQSAMPGDIVKFLVNAITESFILALRMSSAFICSGTVIYIVIAILGRLAPQIQFFFLMMPAQIWLGLCLFALTIKGLILFYISKFM